MRTKLSFGWCVWVLALLFWSGCGGQAIATGEPTPTFTPTPSLIPSLTLTPTPLLVLGQESSRTPQISPTPACNQLELEIDYQQIQQAEDFYAQLTAKGSIPLTIDFSQTPPLVKGSGEAEVGGGGHAGDCSFVYTGSLEYDLHGEVLFDRQPPVLALSGTRGSRNLSASGTNCGGGLISPIFTDDVPLFEIEYRDGATLNYSFTVPTFYGEAVWTLHFRCP
ncbi:MAG: hypothetical protein AB1457_17305 [Chloroflexota bacterium]